MKFILTLIAALTMASSVCAEPQIPKPGKVTLLNLESDCIPCDLQDRIVNKLEKAFGDKVAFIYVDVEKNPQYKQKYKVEVLPTLVFYDKSGNEVDRRWGYMKEGAMRKLLEKLLEQ